MRVPKYVKESENLKRCRRREANQHRAFLDWKNGLEFWVMVAKYVPEFGFSHLYDSQRVAA